MWPILCSFTFLSMGLVCTALVTAVVLRRCLEDRLGRWQGFAVAIACGICVGCLAAAVGWVAWLGPWTLTGYAAAFVVAVLAAVRMIRAAALYRDIDPAHVSELVAVTLISGLLGARARYVWENLAQFRLADGGLDWHKIVDLDRGGMVLYGSVLLGTAVVGFVAWRRRLPVLRLADAVAPGLMLGIAIGRIGCFLNGCCYGRACGGLPWGIPDRHLPEVHRHPTQLYETLACLLMTGVLWGILRRRPRSGLVAAAFCVGYGIWRFINETLRDDYRHPGTLNQFSGWIFTNSQVTSLLLIVAGLGLAAWAATRPTTPTPEAPAPR